MRTKNVVLIFVLTLFPKSVLAFGDTEGECDAKKGAGDWLETGFGCIPVDRTIVPTAIERVYALALFIGFTVAVIMIVLGGIQYITSSGNPQTLESARERITSALWGLGLLVLAFILLNTIGVAGNIIQ